MLKSAKAIQCKQYFSNPEFLLIIGYFDRIMYQKTIIVKKSFTQLLFSVSGSDYHGVGPTHLGTKPYIMLLGLTWRGLMLIDVEACRIGWVEQVVEIWKQSQVVEQVRQDSQVEKLVAKWGHQYL